MTAELFGVFPELFNLLQNRSDIFLVGGAIRDHLLQRPIHDLDFVMSADVRPVARHIADQFHGAFYMLDAQRNTARVILKRESAGEKLTLDFAQYQGENIEDDLRHRDFTVNSLAISLGSPDQLIDPCKGLMDLRQKCLRSCSSEAMIEDPVRILRGIRLSVDFQMHFEKNTQQEMLKAVRSISTISNERLRDELFRILEGKTPSSAVRLLDHFGVNSILLPELQSMKGVSQSTPHSLDVWEHTLATIRYLDVIFNILINKNRGEAENLFAASAVAELGSYRPYLHDHFEKQLNLNRSRRSILFFTALYHDIGKPSTISIEEDGRIRFLNHETIGAEITENRSRELALSQNEIDYAKTLIENHLRPHFLSQTNGSLTRRSIYRFFHDVGEAGIDTCLLSLADFLATHNANLDSSLWLDRLETCRILFDSWWQKKEEYVQPARLLTGDDLQIQFQLTPGPLIGHLLEVVREAQAAGEILNREQALDYIKKKLAENPQ
jgi:putative nucleotidyltransferase with HDIG domain